MKSLLLACVFCIAVPGGTAMADGSYTGSYPLTITGSDHSDGSYCLTLTDDGSFGRPHSGSAQLSGGPLIGVQPYGYFQVISHVLVASAVQQLGTGENAGLIFTGPAANGEIRKAVYDQDYGGYENDTGKVEIGQKNGC